MNAKQFFLNKFFGCYIKTTEKRPGSIFYVFNPQIIRQKKLCRITGEKLNLDMVDETKSIILFEQDMKNEYFYIDYDNVWSILESKCGYNYQEIKDLTCGWLNEDLKIGQYATLYSSSFFFKSLNEDLKIGQYATMYKYPCSIKGLNEDLKIGQYATQENCAKYPKKLNEDLKIGQYATQIGNQIHNRQLNEDLKIGQYKNKLSK